ncbi:DUF3330 domain-containing protein [Thiohalophilus sp.]|uniref:DUF3330 domain-containing protein n=1 Tax=Thiohalophilus sp. TaxID=3028392 RepID=UPI003A0FF752
MSKKPGSPEQASLPEKVSCTVCRKEVPRVDALKDEGEEYIRWFCGLDCYNQWRQDENENS